MNTLSSLKFRTSGMRRKRIEISLKIALDIPCVFDAQCGVAIIDKFVYI